MEQSSNSSKSFNVLVLNMLKFSPNEKTTLEENYTKRMNERGNPC